MKRGRDKTQTELQEEIKELEQEYKASGAKIDEMKEKSSDSGVDGEVIEGGRQEVKDAEKLEALNKAEKEQKEAEEKITKLKNQLAQMVAEEEQTPTPAGVSLPSRVIRKPTLNAYNAFSNGGVAVPLDAAGLVEMINANQAPCRYNFSESGPQKVRATYNEHDFYFNISRSNNNTSITVADDNALMDDVKLSNMAVATMEIMASIINPTGGRKDVEITLGGTLDRQEAVAREFFKAAFQQGLHPWIDEKLYPHFDTKRQDLLRSEAKKEAGLSLDSHQEEPSHKRPRKS